MCAIKVTRSVFVAALALGARSLGCLALYFLALTDIWHESGRPDLWRGQGLCAYEWRFLGVCFWPMLLFRRRTSGGADPNGIDH